MCQFSRIRCCSPGHVQCRDAKVCGQLERRPVHAMPQYVASDSTAYLWKGPLMFVVFTKLASQLTAEKLPELAVIPVIFAVQTLVSYLCAIGVSKICGFKKRPRNFVVAMGVWSSPWECQFLHYLTLARIRSLATPIHYPSLWSSRCPRLSEAFIGARYLATMTAKWQHEAYCTS